jgi:two-component sensor histidine kinase
MAIIHECLYQSPDIGRMDFPDYVEKLTDSLLRTYSVHPEKNTIHLNVDEVSLNLDVAIPCGLIITELVSNALKYAYPEGKEGAVYVHFRSLPGNRHELTVADEGVGLKGPVDFESSQSLGLRLVHILTEQLRGRLRVENGVGAKFTVTF